MLELLPAKCRAYEKAGGVDVLVVVIDADHDDPSWLYRSLEMTVRQFAPSISFVFGIAVEEMESWLLGDKEAVLAAYPKADQKVIDRYEQDSLVGTWEVLCRAIYKDLSLIHISYSGNGRRSEAAIRRSTKPAYRSSSSNRATIISSLSMKSAERTRIRSLERRQAVFLSLIHI